MFVCLFAYVCALLCGCFWICSKYLGRPLAPRAKRLWAQEVANAATQPTSWSISLGKCVSQKWYMILTHYLGLGQRKRHQTNRELPIPNILLERLKVRIKPPTYLLYFTSQHITGFGSPSNGPPNTFAIRPSENLTAWGQTPSFWCFVDMLWRLQQRCKGCWKSFESKSLAIRGHRASTLLVILLRYHVVALRLPFQVFIMVMLCWGLAWSYEPVIVLYGSLFVVWCFVVAWVVWVVRGTNDQTHHEQTICPINHQAKLLLPFFGPPLDWTFSKSLRCTAISPRAADENRFARETIRWMKLSLRSLRLLPHLQLYEFVGRFI